MNHKHTYRSDLYEKNNQIIKVVLNSHTTENGYSLDIVYKDLNKKQIEPICYGTSKPLSYITVNRLYNQICSELLNHCNSIEINDVKNLFEKMKLLIDKEE